MMHDRERYDDDNEDDESNKNNKNANATKEETHGKQWPGPQE